VEGCADVKVLVCLDRSEVSRKVIRRVTEWFVQRAGEDQLTLYHVAEFLPEYLLSDHPEPGLTTRSLAERWAAKARTDGENLLKEAQESLIAGGFPASALSCKLDLEDCRPESKKVAAALAIIREMQSGQYDLVCIGRRGVSELAVSPIGGVTEKVIREAHGRSVLVVD
jgi:nucleotide-binding universal stress UspA family protein